MTDTTAPEAPPKEPVPPQTPEAARALAIRQANTGVVVAENLAITQMLGRPDRGLERIETVMVIPPDYMYAIEKRRPTGKRADGSATGWMTESVKVGLTADGYDYMNRTTGASFFLPEKVPSRKGTMEFNPILDRDYIRLRMGAVWYTPLGQAVLHIEDVEVDFGLIYIDKRANAKSAKIVLDDRKQPLFDELGNPVIELDAQDNLKVIRELTRHRAFGPRYAITVGRVRLLKMATGLRSLPSEAYDFQAGRVKAFRVKVTGYRDQMTPYERIASVGTDLKALFGVDDPSQLRNPDDNPDLRPLSTEEQAEAGLNVTEQVSREDDTGAEAEPVEDIQAPADARVVSPEEQDAVDVEVKPFSPEDVAGIDAEVEQLGL